MLQAQSLFEFAGPPDGNFYPNAASQRYAQAAVEKWFDARDERKVENLLAVGTEKQFRRQFFLEHIQAFAMQRFLRAEMDPNVVILTFKQKNISEPDEITFFTVFYEYLAIRKQLRDAPRRDA